VGHKPLDYASELNVAASRGGARRHRSWRRENAAAACAIIARMRHRGLVVDAFKAPASSLRRDILAFEDSERAPYHDLHRSRDRHTTEKCGPLWRARC